MKHFVHCLSAILAVCALLFFSCLARAEDTSTTGKWIVVSDEPDSIDAVEELLLPDAPDTEEKFTGRVKIAVEILIGISWTLICISSIILLIELFTPKKGSNKISDTARKIMSKTFLMALCLLFLHFFRMNCITPTKEIADYVGCICAIIIIVGCEAYRFVVLRKENHE